MTVYHFFRVDPTGRIAAREQHECSTNNDAYKTARDISKGHDVEIWRGSVRIGMRKRDRLSSVTKHLFSRTPPAAD